MTATRDLDQLIREVAELKTRLDKYESTLDGNAANDPSVKKHKFRIIIPSTTGVSEEGSTENFEARRALVLEFLVRLFGGATCSNPCHGAYRAEDGSVVTEQVVSVTSFCTATEFRSLSPTVIRMVEGLCGEWGQECIGLEMDGVLTYVEPRRSAAIHSAAAAQNPYRRLSLLSNSNRSSLIEMHCLANPGRPSDTSQISSLLKVLEAFDLDDDE
mmetsp:Transcript_13104/g.28875  ORF Transcript_13104/g.28875 Transcript_13104/m.28875 type:complete len:215 (-) Transcript_13104:191-835(-)|eukprot:CAMPEP_0113323560 /NCGR_PEP_ID=MMETSP0010_2-20120614/16401_1 /TAXON_ID=216773 ORGANISM="Corethron hystrix, Strain 308" /NCGR_SAMPLE_ID=MMETSP0010_2 /ASSEMBLY_ACC=CAM_ASM_000155 /LENGTH=214 /DNA_ID=CAMNT_0000182529 /DNA_START=114 /DNA_END=761 /DNA_ORIENTATION=+ /assembly_acc=CAM_ASM_000155